MRHHPTVSCIITTRNRRGLVDRAIRSVLEQTYPCTELIIIDDASSDQTVEYLQERYADNPGITVIRNRHQLGPALARNKGTALAGGEYVSFLDDDDQWLPGKIERQLLLAAQGYDFVTMTRARYVFEGHFISHYGPKLQTVTLRDLFRRNVIINVSPLIKATLMRRVGFDPKLWCGEDYDAWIRLLKKGTTTINLNEPLVVLHKTAGNSLNKMRKNKFRGRRQIYAKHKKLMNSKEKMLFHLMTLAKLAVPDPRYHQKRIQRLMGID